MAATCSKAVAQRIANFGNRILCFHSNNNNNAISPASALTLTLRREAHSSVYEKNPEEQIRPTVVPDHVIQPTSENYWTPHPQTGVFGPPTDHATSAKRDARVLPAAATEGSVLELKAWFRHTGLEDLEKPHTL